ncbi:MAG: hypothetical protein OEZ11_16620, partial [Gammaproteobacteria bacterium]|nr:hypothetical protein [Gammaproteobacteria bacterium]
TLSRLNAAHDQRFEGLREVPNLRALAPAVRQEHRRVAAAVGRVEKIETAFGATDGDGRAAHTPATVKSIGVEPMPKTVSSAMS